MIRWEESRVCVTGGAGFLGRVVCRLLLERGVVPDQLIIPRRAEYDLTQEAHVERLYREQQPDVVIHLAAEVGGIGANMAQPGRFFFANMAMGMHLIEHARLAGIRKFVHTGTVCAYPKFAPVPFQESELWNGYPEETNAPYGVAKKALFVMLDAYYRQYGLHSAVVVPVNLYGPGDNFDPEQSHVIPALIRKCTAAVEQGNAEIVCWGSGTASREFLYVDDAAQGIVQAAEVMEEPIPINLGTGREITIAKLVQLIAERCDFKGRIRWDASRPDGQPRRCLDTSRAAELLQWQATMSLEEGLRRTIRWWREQQADRIATR
ncbi:MAG TPA: GDP-L-fucose synthase [Pirellulales bacterium]|jgi:GDP-L-fucose synthase|nr:GDP-L-fucose synthase [Pirellulales bacterium]